MTRRIPARAALLALSFVIAALLLVPAGASASHFANAGTTSNCNPAPSTDCTLNVQLSGFYSYSNTTISVQLDPGYTFDAVPGIGATNCAITPTVTLQSPTLAHIYFAGFSPACTFGLLEKLAFTSTPAPTTLPCQTFDTFGNSPPYYICATADTLAPPAPTIASTPASPNPSTTPDIRGIAEPFSTVQLYATGDCSGTPADTSTAAAYNSPGFPVIVAADTSATFSTTATDAAGNTSSCSSAFTYTSDTIAPNEPTLDTITPGSPANTRTLFIAGTAEAGSTVRLFATADCSGPSLVSGTSGAYAAAGLGFTLPSDGTRTYHATATDAAGNVSPCSTDSITHTVDTVAPATPVISGSSPASPADSAKPEIRGTAEAGSTIRLYLTADCSGAIAVSGTAADFGAEGLTVTVPSDATSQISARTADDAGNMSSCSNAISYVEDSTTPVAPVLTGFDPTPVSNSNAPRVRGTAEAGSTVRLYTTATCTGTPEAAGSAAAFASPGLLVSVASDQTTTFYATTTDAAGHTSACSSGLGYDEDSTAPPAPTITATDPASPANDNTVLANGSAADGSTVRIYATGDCSGASEQSGTAAAFASPGLSVTVADDSTTSLRAAATDAAGNASACSAPVTYVEDSTAPAVPSITSSSPASPANDASPRLMGSAGAGSTVSIYTTSDCTGASVADGSAAAFADPGLQVSAAADDTTTYYAAAGDSAGNASACSEGFSYREDSTTPDEPTLTATVPSSASNDNSPRVKGSAEAGSTVALYITSDCTGTPAASGDAAGFADPGLSVTVGSDQTTTFYATATDAADNTSSCSQSSIDYAEDSTAPSVPTFAGTTPLSPSSDNTPEVTGAADAGTTVRLYASADCSGGSIATGTPAEFADPGLTVTLASDSETQISASATDDAGNVTCSTATVTYVEDSSAPAAPAIAGFNPASPANANSPKVKGSGEAGTTVRIYASADCSGAVAATGTMAAFAAGLTVTVADNTTTQFSATAADALDNVSPCSAAAAYVEDSAGPAAPVLAATSPASPANDNRPSIKGTAEAGSSVRIYASAICAGGAVASGSAATLADAGIQVLVADDSQTMLSAIAIDAAGNASPCSTAIRYSERTTPAAVAPAPDRVAPRSTIARLRAAQRRSRRVTLRGTADGTGSAVQAVRISVARLAGTKCRFLSARGTFGAARSCARTTYLTAGGGKAWSLALPKLAKGSYKVRSRAIDTAGNVERKDATRNLLRFRLL